MLPSILNLSRNKKRTLFVVFDIVALIMCCWLSFALRYEDWGANNFAHWPSYLLAPIVSIPIFVRLGLYRAVIRYIGYKALWTAVKAITLALLVWAVATYILGLSVTVPRSVIFIFWFISIVVVGGARMVARWVILHQFPGGEQKAKSDSERVIIYGAGASGRQLAEALYHSKEFIAVAYVDDNSKLQGLDVNGICVYSPDEIDLLVEKYDVKTVLLAIPSASRQRRRDVVDKLSVIAVKVLTLPGLTDLAGGKVSVSDVREVDIADLLGREEVRPNQELLDACIQGKNVLVTGAGGSIGSELCRQVLKQGPSVLVLYEMSEFALYSIDKELSSLGLDVEIISILGNVLDGQHLAMVLREYNVNTIYHAAAYKHVPLVENNNVAGIRNNLIGTWRTAEAALASKVNNFVLISTDKAVRPTNVMGASKRFSELVLQAISDRERGSSSTRFTMVRFGNVLGSSGSVIPLFKEQIKQGGPVTVTHRDITRYFMTIPEAASLVIQAGSMGATGDVYVLDMGEPVKIENLAKQMVNLTGLSVKDADNPNGDIEIQYTGLRDGEKLYEELLIGDNVLSTDHPMIMRAQEEMIEWNELSIILVQLQQALDRYDHQEIRDILLDNVSGYRPQHGIKDILYSQRTP
jgi:FlaA1/EpsC-like NDP-sugar epimerase